MKRGILFLSLFLVSILFISGCETQFSGRSCSIESCDSQACLEIQNVDTTDNTLDVCINNSLNLGGFQFEVLGVEITGAGGGISEEYEWMVSNSPSTVLGFTLSGNYILQGEGILTMVSFNNPGDEICFGEDTGSAGLTTLSDSGGGYVNSVDWGDCYCTTDEDCFGVCGGDAVVDECDVCGGSGIPDGDCDCDGNILDNCDVCGGDGSDDLGCGCFEPGPSGCDNQCGSNLELDCAGLCGGNAVVDECGECGGPGIPDGYCDCFGNVLDECDECGGPGSVYECGCYDIPDGDCDCNGNILDECGECGGPGIPDGDCDCFGNVLDACEVCDGPGSVYECGCYDIPDGDCDCNGNILDECDVCGGEGSSCATIICDAENDPSYPAYLAGDITDGGCWCEDSSDDTDFSCKFNYDYLEYIGFVGYPSGFDIGLEQDLYFSYNYGWRQSVVKYCHAMVDGYDGLSIDLADTSWQSASGDEDYYAFHDDTYGPPCSNNNELCDEDDTGGWWLLTSEFSIPTDYYLSETICHFNSCTSLGDINGDGGYNVLDILQNLYILNNHN